MSEDKSYVIGTHAAEIERLGVQHRVWRASVLDFWRLGGLTEGMTVIDAGCGPGHATLDLAEIVGATGRVIALERSRRFLDALEAQARQRGLANIETVETDLADFDWTGVAADRLWCRWVLAFVSDPVPIVQGMARALKPGGALLFHEYYDYAAWRLAPRSDAFEDYVGRIIARWRASGGEPDIALKLPRLLTQAGLTVESTRPVVFAARMSDFASRWPMGFAREYLPTMIANGDVTPAEGEALQRVFQDYEADPNALVITPGILQIVARKPA
ncbi:MAG TPA: methyltransferase domain-containing protein [Rhizomicrobium sp.]